MLTAYLADAQARYISVNDVRLAVASYYQGPTSVRTIGLLPDTQAYVAAVLAFRPAFR